MKRAIPLLLVGLLALIGLAAPASAQTTLTQSSTQVDLAALPEPIGQDGMGVIQGRVEYTATFLHALTTHTNIRLSVAETPDWAVVAVSPSTIVIPTSSFVASQSVTYSASFEVMIALAEDAPEDASGLIKVVAVAEQSGPVTGSAGEDQTLIQTAGSNDSTESKPTRTSAGSDAQGADEDAADGSLKEPASLDGGGLPAIGFLGASGALVGLVARTAWVRQKR